MWDPPPPHKIPPDLGIFCFGWQTLLKGLRDAMDGTCELLGGVMSQEDLSRAVSAEVGRGRKMTRLPPTSPAPRLNSVL